jgi:hypothetical protein
MTFTLNLHRNLIELALVSHKPYSNDCRSVRVRATMSNMFTCKRVLTLCSGGESLFKSILLGWRIPHLVVHKPQQRWMTLATMTKTPLNLTLSVSSDISVTIPSRDSNRKHAADLGRRHDRVYHEGLVWAATARALADNMKPASGYHQHRKSELDSRRIGFVHEFTSAGGLLDELNPANPRFGLVYRWCIRLTKGGGS